MITTSFSILLHLAPLFVANAEPRTPLGVTRLFELGSYTVTSDDAWVLGTAVVCSIACAVLGCFLVLRRMSLLGDAISHAILPGLGIAFILFHSRAPGPMLLGAAAVGVLTAVLANALHRWGRVQADAAMGVVFTILFALGVLLISWVARDVDLDPGCVLYGLIEFVPLDTRPILGFEIPRAFITLSIVAGVNLALVALFFKELRIVSFDPALAVALGLSAGFVHYGLMAAIAATTVVSFEAVGSILVVSMLVGPAATAQLLTDRLSRMVWLAATIGAGTAVLGYIPAVALNTSVAGMMSVAMLCLFVIAAIFAPRHGVLSKALARVALSVRITREDILAMLFRMQELHQAHADVRLVTREVASAVGGGPLARLALLDLRRRRLVSVAAGSPELTAAGEAAARTLVRAHRLWETFLATRLGVPLDHVHEPSHRVEHFVTARMRDDLARDIGPGSDPHGRAIPPG